MYAKPSLKEQLEKQNITALIRAECLDALPNAIDGFGRECPQLPIQLSNGAGRPEA